MNVIFNSQAARELSKSFVVLRLPKIQDTECFVVLDQSAIPLEEIPLIDTLRNLHHDLVDAFADNDAEFCLETLPRLRGKFSGQLDSFYDHVEQEISNIRA